MPDRLAPTAEVIGCSTVIVSPNGGTEPYMFSISGRPFQSSNVFEDVPAGDYSILVKDDNGCTGRGAVTVSNSWYCILREIFCELPR